MFHGLVAYRFRWAQIEDQSEKVDHDNEHADGKARAAGWVHGAKQKEPAHPDCGSLHQQVQALRQVGGSPRRCVFASQGPQDGLHHQ